MDHTFMLNAMMLNRINSDNTVIGIISTVIGFILFSFLSNRIKAISFDFASVNWNQMKDWNYIVKYFSKKNKVEYEGKLTSRIDRYDHRLCQSTCFSNNFSALWKHIIDHAEANPLIYAIKECNVTLKTSTQDKDDSLFIVNQPNEFLIDAENEIYAITYNFRETNDEEEAGKAKQNANKTDRIIIELHSIKCSVARMKEFVDALTEKHLASIEEKRENKQFVYSLMKLEFDDESHERWKESPFESTRTFQNLFFDNREMVMKKVDYFLQNKAWYFEKGIPYSLGIGIHGPPGTGKTSFIKALANYTKRHIVTISLKMIKTKKQLEGIFFENRYSSNNKKNSVGFDKKIIVFEDIDCVGDIVKDRATKSPCISFSPSQGFGIPDDKELKNGFVKIDGLSSKPLEDPITLDDILNLWDGICETPGRIMVLTSNHYDELDPALKRPGRVDVTLEMQKASRQIIAEMHNHLFKQVICDDALARIPDRFYSPAEIINVYMNETTDSARFCERLCQAKNV